MYATIIARIVLGVRKENDMAKIKYEVNESPERVRFGDLKIGDIFMYSNEPYIKTVDRFWAVNLSDGCSIGFDKCEFVYCVKIAELIITI